VLDPPRWRLRAILEVLLVFARLGVTSFGGPVAHLGYFRHELVARRKWVDERTYADLVALCQFLPGPASSQVGMGLGLMRAGVWGSVAAWIGFTLPSAALMVAFAYGVTAIGDITAQGWLHGLVIVAVPVVALAVWGMGRTLTPDRPRFTLAALAAVATLLLGNVWSQLIVIAAGGLMGWQLLKAGDVPRRTEQTAGPGRVFAVGLLALFLALIILLPVARQFVASGSVAVADSFYRVGSLVFGGSHVVLPLIQQEVAPPGWVTNEQFVAGYGAAQAVPGPLFTFSAYLGAVSRVGPGGWLGGVLALCATFFPSLLLVWGALPFWERLRVLRPVQSALMGVNAAVVGILLAALYDPVWTSAIRAPEDVALALAGFALLAFWRWPPWLVVVLSALGGQALAWV
jgi:chromate transporter